MEPLFFDTNSVNSNNRLDRLFGNRAMLKKLEKDYRLMLASVVRDELVEHSKGLFLKSKKDFLTNYFTSNLPEQAKAVDAKKFDELLPFIFKNEEIAYEVVEFGRPDEFIDKFVPLAIEHRPPFEEGSDKGFKDACIAHTVECYAEENGRVLFLTADNRLFQYFAESDLVSVFKDANDLFKRLAVSRADDSAESLPKQDAVECSSLPISEFNNVSASECLSSDELVNNLCQSYSFLDTHNAIEKIVDSGQILSDRHAVKALRSAVNNSQILWLLQDQDVADFFIPIFDKWSDVLSDKEYNAFVDAAGLPNERKTEYGSFQLSRSEREAYRCFVDGLLGHIINRDCSSQATSDSEVVLAGLKELLSVSSIDEQLLKWGGIVSLFLSGGFYTSDEPVDPSLVKTFYEMLRACSKEKREEVVRRVAQRIDELDCELVF